MGTNECSQPAFNSSWDSQDFGDVSMVLKMVHFRKSTRPQWGNQYALRIKLTNSSNSRRPPLQNNHMEAIWKFMSTYIITIITYAGVPREPIKENQKLNQPPDRIIKLMVPESTPREALYIEAGLLDIETITDRNMMIMGERIKNNGGHILSGMKITQY